MKKVLLGLALSCAAVAGKAQTLTVINTTTCPVTVRAHAFDWGSPPNTISTAHVPVPTGGTPLVLTIADLGYPPVGAIQWEYAVVVDPAWSGPGPEACNVGDPAAQSNNPAYYPPWMIPNTPFATSCSFPCGGRTANVTYTQMGTSARVNIF